MVTPQPWGALAVAGVLALSTLVYISVMIHITHEVDDSDWPDAMPLEPGWALVEVGGNLTLEEALSNATGETELRLRPGTHTISDVLLDRSLKIAGNGSDTYLKVNGSVRITADRCVLSSFVLQVGLEGENRGAISIAADEVTIYAVEVHNVDTAAIWTDEKGNDGDPPSQITVEKCRFTGNRYGIRIKEGKHCWVRDNVCAENTKDGITVTSLCYVENNSCKGNEIGISVWSGKNRIKDNNCGSNSVTDIRFNVPSNHVSGNSGEYGGIDGWMHTPWKYLWYAGWFVGAVVVFTPGVFLLKKMMDMDK